MISVIQLQELLTDNFDLIQKIMVHLGFDKEKIKYDENKHLITSPRPDKDADNPNGCLIYTHNLYVMMTTRSFVGNIFTLTMKIKQCNFPIALDYISKWVDAKLFCPKIKLPFGGFYRDLIRSETEPELLLKEYEDNSLPIQDGLSKQFFDDGVSYEVQHKWGIRYDHITDHILIPIYDYSGRLVGCKARSNDPEVSHDKRWYAYLPYNKTSTLYGWYQNYNPIIEKQTVIIFEAEKSVLQADTFDCHLGIALGGHSISKTQAKYIKSLMVKNIIIAFDKDVCEDEVRYEAEKLKVRFEGLNSRISYIIDKDNLLGQKDSPSDKGKGVFEKLIQNNLTKL